MIENIVVKNAIGTCDERDLVAVVVVVPLGFDFTNGFHDTANAVATWSRPGRCRRGSPSLIAAVLELRRRVHLAAVATTVGKGIVDPGRRHPEDLLAGLVGAITGT